MRVIFTISFVISFLFAWLLSAQANSNEPQAPAILVMGDSLSAAFNIPMEKGWVSLTQQKLNDENYFYRMINASISGETSGGAVTRIKSQIDKFNPSIVIIELGGNDGLRGFNLQELQSNLQKMIDMSKKNGAIVLLAEMKIPPNYGRTYTNKFTEIYSQLAKQENVYLLPFFLKNVADKSNLMQADGIHPNSDAQPIIRDNVLEYLKPLL